MAKFEKRLEARKLRRKGWGINSIAAHLSVSKSSASIWCKDLELTEKQQKKLLENMVRGGHLGRMMGARTNQRKKEMRIEFHKDGGLQELPILTKRELFIAGIALYWGEGNKKSKLGFINSDPEMIKFMFRWFQECMAVKKEDFMPRIFINAIHKPRINKVLAFWSDLLKLPQDQFGNPVFLNRNQKKVYENHNDYFGLLTLQVRRSTDMKYKILGLIDALKTHNMPV